MSDENNKLIEKPKVRFSKSGSPSVSALEILRSKAGQKELEKLRKSKLLRK